MPTQDLPTQVQNRYGGSTSEYLIGLTRPFSRGSTTIDSTVLGLAANDVYAAFRIYAGVVYDESATTNPDHYTEHIAVGVACVIAKLRQFTGQDPVANEPTWDACVKTLTAMSKVGARDRFLVKTDSGTERSDENPNGQTIRPPFDDQMFTRYIPTESPNAPSSTNGPTFNDGN